MQGTIIPLVTEKTLQMVSLSQEIVFSLSLNPDYTCAFSLGFWETHNFVVGGKSMEINFWGQAHTRVYFFNENH